MGRKKKEDTNEKKSLDNALARIEKKFGKGAIMRLDNDDFQRNVEVISTGSLNLDSALGVGGIPKGRVIEIYGQEASGKTTLCLSIIKECQQMGGTTAFVDAEHAFDYNYAKIIGIDMKNLLISQPDSGEQALEIVQTLIESKELDLIVIDSVASLTPKAEIEGEMEDAQIGLQARLMSKAMRKLSGLISQTKTSVIFTNQIREKIGIMFGNPETTPGGRALKFFASVRIDLRRISTLKKGDIPVGTKVRAKVTKNKVAPPFRVAEFQIFFDEGLSKTADILDLAIKHGIIDKSGAWFSYKKTQLGQGLEKTRLYLKENPELLQEIKTLICNLLGK